MLKRELVSFRSAVASVNIEIDRPDGMSTSIDRQQIDLESAVLLQELSALRVKVSFQFALRFFAVFFDVFPFHILCAC